MNKKLLICLGVLLIFSSIFCSTVNGQCALKGNYTINNNLPTDSTNFSSFTEAVNKLNNCGVSGSVIFNVAGGIYNEQVEIDSIAGVNATNTVIIQVASATTQPVELTYKASGTDDNYVIQFNNASFITVRGITVSSKDSAYGRVIHFLGKGRNIILEENKLYGVLVNSDDNDYSVVYLPYGSVYDNLRIQGNEIKYGSTGIKFEYSFSSRPGKGNIISDNQIRDFFKGGINTRGQDSLIIDNNTVMPLPISEARYQLASGIIVSAGENIRITKNRIIALFLPSSSFHQFAGLSVEGYDPPLNSSYQNLISNNVVSIAGKVEGGFGIRILGSSKLMLNHNSVSVKGNSASVALQLSGDENSQISILNNILYSEFGKVISTDPYVLNSIMSMDYNDLYTEAATFGNWGNVYVPDLASWQVLSSLDSHSVSINPEFISDEDLRIYLAYLDNLGKPINGINTDILGNFRSTVTPDIGAYEFTAYDNDVLAMKLLSPRDSSCEDSTTTISIMIFNGGYNDASGFDVGAIVDSQVVSIPYSGVLHSGERDTINLPGFHVLTKGQKEIRTYTHLPGDMYPANDTLRTTLYLQTDIAPAPIAENGYFCKSLPFDTLYFPKGSSGYQWKTTDGNIIGYLPYLIVGPLSKRDTTFVLSPHPNNCNTPDGRITLKYTLAPTADFVVNPRGAGMMGFTVDINASGSIDADTYIWDFGDGSKGRGDSISHTFTSDSTYEIRLIALGNCGSDTVVKTIEVKGISLEENLRSRSLNVYPNPAKDELQLSFNAGGKGCIKLMDLSGKTIFKEDFESTTYKYHGKIDISSLSKGIYFFQVESGEKKETKRVMKL